MRGAKFGALMRNQGVGDFQAAVHEGQGQKQTGNVFHVPIVAQRAPPRGAILQNEGSNSQ